MATDTRIPLGRLVMTRGIAKLFERYPSFVFISQNWLRQHQRVECPHLDQEDQSANQWSAEHGERILTAWPIGLASPEPQKVWIITEADRSVTTLLLPDEY